MFAVAVDVTILALDRRWNTLQVLRNQFTRGRGCRYSVCVVLDFLGIRAGGVLAFHLARRDTERLCPAA